MMNEPELMIEDCPPLPGEEPGPDDVVIPIPREQNMKEEKHMEDKMTIRQVMEITMGLLENIEVPMKYMESIGGPIMNAIHNLGACIQATDMAEAMARKQAEAAEEPKAEEQEDERNADDE